jgi:hypothetical protein
MSRGGRQPGVVDAVLAFHVAHAERGADAVAIGTGGDRADDLALATNRLVMVEQGGVVGCRGVPL